MSDPNRWRSLQWSAIAALVGVAGGAAFVHYAGPDLVVVAIVGAFVGVITWAMFRW